jgi:hypothetical protein
MAVLPLAAFLSASCIEEYHLTAPKPPASTLSDQAILHCARSAIIEATAHRALQSCVDEFCVGLAFLFECFQHDVV